MPLHLEETVNLLYSDIFMYFIIFVAESFSEQIGVALKCDSIVLHRLLLQQAIGCCIFVNLFQTAVLLLLLQKN